MRTTNILEDNKSGKNELIIANRMQRQGTNRNSYQTGYANTNYVQNGPAKYVPTGGNYSGRSSRQSTQTNGVGQTFQRESNLNHTMNLGNNYGNTRSVPQEKKQNPNLYQTMDGLNVINELGHNLKREPDFGQTGRIPVVSLPSYSAYAQQINQEREYGISVVGNQSNANLDGYISCRNVIAVASTKGGVGKSTISKELATALAQIVLPSGKKLKVCLLDLDVEFGDISSMLYLQSSVDMSEWIYDIENKMKAGYGMDFRNYYYTNEQIRYFLQDHSSGLKILQAPRVRGHENRISAEIMKVMLYNVGNMDFDVIIMDMGCNTYEYTMEALKMSSQILLVGNTEYSAINCISSMMDVLYSKGIQRKKMDVVLNKVYEKAKMNACSIRDICNYLNIKDVYSYLPYYETIHLVNNSGIPAVMRKKTKYSQAMMKLAIKIASKMY